MKHCSYLLASALLLGTTITTHAQIISTYAGNYMAGGTPSTGDGGPATAAGMLYTYAVAMDNAGNLYIGEGNRHVRKVSPSGIIANFAGTGVLGYTGDGGLATAADITWPNALAVDGAGSVFIAQHDNCVIRKVWPSGIITTVAGNGICGTTGDGGPATAAQIFSPLGLCTDPSGNLYIADYAGSIRKVTPAGIISTFAGTGTLGYSGDGGPATNARLFTPSGLTWAGGSLYIADEGNNVIREVDATGIINTIAGNGVGAGAGSMMGSYSGDGGPATAAGLNGPIGVAVNQATGDIFITDRYNHRIRRVNTSGIMSTYTGGAPAGYGGDGGPANSVLAKINLPWGICLDNAGRLYIADELNYVVRRIDTSSNMAPVPSESGSANTCRNTPVSISSLLTTMDVNVGQTLTWTAVSGPFHGTLTGFVATAPSTGSLVTPSGLSYSPAAGYAGVDTFTVEISDGYNAATVTKYVYVDTIPDAGSVTGPDVVCEGDTIALAGTVSAGAWASSNTNASVTAGSVIGLAAGTATIYHIVAGACGSDTASKVVYVLPASMCATGIKTTATPGDPLKVFPNPSSGAFTIYLPANTEMILIRDVAGNMVTRRPLTTTVAQVPATFDGVPPGQYIVTAYAGGKEHSLKLVVR